MSKKYHLLFYEKFHQLASNKLNFRFDCTLCRINHYNQNNARYLIKWFKRRGASVSYLFICVCAGVPSISIAQLLYPVFVTAVCIQTASFFFIVCCDELLWNEPHGVMKLDKINKWKDMQMGCVASSIEWQSETICVSEPSPY